MTLVELLVVVAILGVLAVTVLPNLAGTTERRATRSAATTASSHLSRAQSLAIASRVAGGAWLEPLANNASAVLDLYFSEPQPPYRGDAFDAAYEITVNNPPTSANLVANPPGCDAILTAGNLGDITAGTHYVRFNASSPFFTLKQVAGTLQAQLVANLGQTQWNTIWPASPPAKHTFEIVSLPSRSAQAVSLTNNAAIDLAWSGMGSTRFSNVSIAGDANWTPDATYPAGASVAIQFDGTGALFEVCYMAAGGVSSRTPVRGPVFLLVGRADRCGLPFTPIPTEENPGANWQYPDSYWLAVDPRSGIVKTAEVIPNCLTARDSQAFIRAGLATTSL